MTEIGQQTIARVVEAVLADSRENKIALVRGKYESGAANKCACALGLADRIATATAAESSAIVVNGAAVYVHARDHEVVS